MLIDGAKYNVIHFWKAYGMPNKDWPIFNSKINFDFYFINWWFEAVCCDINSEITLAWLNTRKCVSPKFHSEIQKLCFKNFSKIRQIMAWIKPLYTDFELTVECWWMLIWHVSSFPKMYNTIFCTITQHCTLASCVLWSKIKIFSL